MPKQVIIKLRSAEISDLLYMIEQHKEGGSYFPPKEQFMKRQDGIIEKLTIALKQS